MITLTTPAQIATVLGSASKTNYDRMDVTTINYDVLNQNISGSCRIYSSVSPSSQTVFGNYSISAAGQVQVSIPNLPFFASISLTAPQTTVVQGWISDAQNNVEGGLTSIGVVSGTQSSGV